MGSHIELNMWNGREECEGTLYIGLTKHNESTDSLKDMKYVITLKIKNSKYLSI